MWGRFWYTVCLWSTDLDYFVNYEQFQNFDQTYNREVGDDDFSNNFVEVGFVTDLKIGVTTSNSKFWTPTPIWQHTMKKIMKSYDFN